MMSKYLILTCNSKQTAFVNEQHASVLQSAEVVRCEAEQNESIDNHQAEEFDGIFAVDDATNRDILSKLAKALKPGASICIYSSAKDEADKNKLTMQLMMNGFVELNGIELTNDSFKQVVNGSTNGYEINGLKPSYDAGTSATFVPKANKKKWTVVADEFDGEDDTIDEDTLLDDAPVQKRRDDCEVGKDGKRRACKDCTCGRKDMDDSVELTPAEQQQQVSNCGNCYKGDAFRCGSCPFLGKPAFKPGMGKVVLNLDNSDDL